MSSDRSVYQWQAICEWGQNFFVDGPYNIKVVRPIAIWGEVIQIMAIHITWYCSPHSRRPLPTPTHTRCWTISFEWMKPKEVYDHRSGYTNARDISSSTWIARKSCGTWTLVWGQPLHKERKGLVSLVPRAQATPSFQCCTLKNNIRGAWGRG